MRVLVCGGRDYEYPSRVADALSEHGATIVIHGHCRTGADAHADEWARRCGLSVLRFPADWDRYGRAAGPVRNAQMLVEGKPDLVLAFPGGRGTADMVRRAREAGVRVVEVQP